MQRFFYTLIFLTWIVLWIRPFWALVVTLGVFIAFVLIVGWSAISSRQSGWAAGGLLAILLFTLPGWIYGLYKLYELLPRETIPIITP